MAWQVKIIWLHMNHLVQIQCHLQLGLGWRGSEGMGLGWRGSKGWGWGWRGSERGVLIFKCVWILYRRVTFITQRDLATEKIVPNEIWIWQKQDQWDMKLTKIESQCHLQQMKMGLNLDPSLINWWLNRILVENSGVRNLISAQKRNLKNHPSVKRVIWIDNLGFYHKGGGGWSKDKPLKEEGFKDFSRCGEMASTRSILIYRKYLVCTPRGWNQVNSWISARLWPRLFKNCSDMWWSVTQQFRKVPLFERPLVCLSACLSFMWTL